MNSAQPARRAAVDRAREAWIRRLIDLSRRNNLLYYRDLKTERVQGDERDAIILTLGTGKDRAGRLDHRQVRPLNQKGGERRLNFAITRARRRMTLVSSFTRTAPARIDVTARARARRARPARPGVASPSTGRIARPTTSRAWPCSSPPSRVTTSPVGPATWTAGW